MAQRKQPSVFTTETECRTNQYRVRSFDLWNTKMILRGKNGIFTCLIAGVPGMISRESILFRLRDLRAVLGHEEIFASDDATRGKT